MKMHNLLSSVLIISLSVAISAGTSTGAWAQQAPTVAKSAGHAFAKLDTNGDGVISRSEAAAKPKLAEHFDEIDTNKDGVLSRDELKAAHKKHAGAKFAKLDTDQDGRLSRSEAEAAPRLAKHFDSIDTNHDGYISRDELKAARQQHANQ